MKEKRSLFKRELSDWGEIITCDHVYSGSLQSLGLDGETETFVIKDLFSGLMHAFPVPSKSASHVVQCIQQFVGSRKIQLLYSDNAREFLGSCKELVMPRDGGQPGVHHTNGVIERCNQLAIGGTATCLIEAGLPPCYWSYGSPCFCFNLNTQSICVESPWERTHGTPFLHTRFPFGCLVMFKPNEVRTTNHKWAPKAEWGVFAGYRLCAGYKWRGEYLVWRLSDFQRSDLRVVATKHKQGHVSSPHVTKVVVLPDTGITFPLKADYNRVNQAVFDQSVVNTDEDAMTMAHPFDGPGRGYSEVLNQCPQPLVVEETIEENENAYESKHDANGDPVEIVQRDDPKQEVPPTALAESGIAPEPTPEELLEIDKAFNRQNFEHVRMGQASDGEIYVNNNGTKVKLDKRGQQYSVDLEGVRNSMRSSRPSDISPEMWKQMGPNRLRLAAQSTKASASNPSPNAHPPASDPVEAAVVADGWQVVGSRKTKRTVLIPQTESFENDKDANAFSALSRAEHSPEKALPAVEESSKSGSSSENDDVSVDSDRGFDPVPIYNQFGTLYDLEVEGQVAQASPPLMRDVLPSRYDPNKYGVRPSNFHNDTVPFFYVTANGERVSDPLPAREMGGRSWNRHTIPRPSSNVGLDEISDPVQP